ncbi:N-acetylmuramoyl-L-alanine amidase [Streptomyces sparsogenes]|uniref:N-acetylmuramoyl-L-alanine amidase n=1 Tax=Streptomyces sparsogenes DSM 40356 TaxID=1331668 RepID=A0A1R1SQY1_9ACTN|nr:peptidoglycan recognition family protein [Streptomyces sparsogenes]OMI40449.1 N-acetylmuramoyl-L-alanine amidase [Streptomyces sparsogenes DSM 40356]
MSETTDAQERSASDRDPGQGDRAGRRGGGRRLGRRALLTGGVAAGLAGVGYAAWDDLERLWWRLPGVDRPREEGAVDYPGARWDAASPANWRRADRPYDYTVDRVVIHVVQGSFSDALAAFRNPGHRAAAHYVVRRDGAIAQTVRELDVAFHAGNRAYNERSVGIEHEGFVDRPSSFTDRMYRASARLTARICERYGFPADREHLVNHSEVPGTDHTDPGPHWDWDRYLRLVRAAMDGRETTGNRA